MNPCVGDVVVTPLGPGVVYEAWPGSPRVWVRQNGRMVYWRAAAVTRAAPEADESLAVDSPPAARGG